MTDNSQQPQDEAQKTFNFFSEEERPRTSPRPEQLEAQKDFPQEKVDELKGFIESLQNSKDSILNVENMKKVMDSVDKNIKEVESFLTRLEPTLKQFRKYQ